MSTNKVLLTNSFSNHVGTDLNNQGLKVVQRSTQENKSSFMNRLTPPLDVQTQYTNSQNSSVTTHQYTVNSGSVFDVGDTFYVVFPEVYAKVQSFKQSLINDIFEVSKYEYNNIESVIDEMSGQANTALMEALHINKQKTFSMIENIDSILAYIDFSAHQMEQSDDQIANEINSERK